MILLQSDGNNIFKSNTENNARVYLTDDDEGAANTLPSWSYDGLKIVYTRQVPGEASYVWIMDADGSNQRQVTSLGGANFAPFFTPDGKRIIFSSNHPNPRSRNFDLYLVNVDGSGLEQVTSDGEFDGFPMFSPDGTKLVWASNRGNAADSHSTNLFLADWK